MRSTFFSTKLELIYFIVLMLGLVMFYSDFYFKLLTFTFSKMSLTP